MMLIRTLNIQRQEFHRNGNPINEIKRSGTQLHELFFKNVNNQISKIPYIRNS